MPSSYGDIANSHNKLLESADSTFICVACVMIMQTSHSRRTGHNRNTFLQEAFSKYGEIRGIAQTIEQ